MKAAANLPKTIDEYVANQPQDVQEILRKIRALVKSIAPESTELISYQMPSYKLNGRYLIHFAAWKNHIGFYPTPSGTSAFKKELSQYEGAKGSVRFPLSEPMPYDLIKRIVEFRAQENQKAK